MVKEDFDNLPAPVKHDGSSQTFSGGRVQAEESFNEKMAKLAFRSKNNSGSFMGSLRFAGESTMNSIRFAGTGIVETVAPVNFSWLREIEKGKSWVAFVSAVSVTLGFMTAFLACFSIWQPFWGWGDQVFTKLKGRTDEAVILGSIAGGILFSLYIFDFWYAPKRIKQFGFFLFFAALICGMVSILFLVESDGSTPLALFIVVASITLAAMKVIFFKSVDVIWYLFSIFIALYGGCIAVMVLWVSWIFAFEKSWLTNNITEEYYDYVGCDYAERLSDVNGTFTKPCNEAFLAWASPGLMSAYAFVFANILVIILRVEARRRREERHQKVEPIAQLFIVFVMGGFLVTWVMSSILATQFIAIGDTFLLFSVILIFKAFVVTWATLGTEYLRTYLIHSPLGIKLVEFSDSDWASALGVFLGSPIFLVYLLLSFIIQSIRKYTPLGKPLKDQFEAELVFQKETQFFFKRMRKWDWGSVLLKVITIGAIWLVVVIGIGRMVNVFLSWLSEILAPLDFVVTTFIFYVTGIALFMLPPVPGLPIYLTGGIVLSQAAQLSAGMDYVTSSLYSILICSLLKGTAICIQQKIIGQMFGSNSVRIKSLVGINSLELRAMRIIMAERGLTIPKVAVLVGGPDWPTSVLTGIMRLDLSQMLLGSLPVIITIVPVCFAGAALLEGENSFYAALAPILLTLSLIIQLTPFFVALHYIAKAAIVHKEQLDSEPLDKDVEEYEKSNKEKQKWGIVLNQWGRLSPVVRLLHILMSILTIIGNLTLWIGGDLCFQPFGVEDTIDEALDGDVSNIIIKPFGLIMLGVVAVPIVYLIIYGQVQGCRVSQKVKSGEEIPAADQATLEKSLAFFDIQMFSARNLERLRNESLKQFDEDDEDEDDDDDNVNSV